MMTLESFWETLVDKGILDYDEMGRAQSRYAECGGGLDTCIIETVILSNEEWEQTMSLIGELMDTPIAPCELYDAPDLDALAQIPAEVSGELPLVPSIDHDGRTVWIIPALQPAILADIEETLATRDGIYIARETDLWMVLNQLSEVPVPPRILSLWRGDIPSLGGDSSNEAPLPIPRSTEFIHELDTVGDHISNTSEHRISLPNTTQPSTPSALGLADTIDFESDELQHLLSKKRIAKMLNSSNALHRIGALTTDVPKLRRSEVTAPPQ